MPPCMAPIEKCDIMPILNQTFGDMIRIFMLAYRSKIFPGLRILFGSKVLLIPLIRLMDSSSIT